jgi:hypothetical protein
VRGKRRQHRSAVLAWRLGFSGVVEQGDHARGITQEPGRPGRFREERTGRGRGTGTTKSPGPRAQRLAGVGANNETRRGTAQRGRPERGGRTDRESEHLDSTCEAGEPTRGTRWREGGCRVTELLEGKMAGTPISEDIST